MKTPKISVLMPVYNAEKYLAESIESILNQTCTDFEFLIMDDGSTDSSSQILKNYAKWDSRIKLFHQQNKGIVDSLNTLIDKAKAPFIARMDADDISLPKRLEEQYKFMKKNKDTVLLGCMCKIFKEGDPKNFGHNTAFEEDFMNRWFLSIIPAFMHSAVLIKKEALINCGKYKKDEYPAEDYGLWIRLKRFGKITTLMETLMSYRITSSGISAKNFKKQIKVRDRLNLVNLEDIYKNHEIPDVNKIKKTLAKYKLTHYQKQVFGKLTCLTGCFLISKKDYKKAKSFLIYSLELDKRRVDSFANLFLGLFRKAFLISIDHYPLSKKNLFKLHWF